MVVELRGLEPLTPSLRTRCATSCATAPWCGRNDNTAAHPVRNEPPRMPREGAACQAPAARRSRRPSSSSSSTSPSKLDGRAGAGSITAAGAGSGRSAFALRVYVGGGTGTGAQPDRSASAGRVRGSTAPAPTYNRSDDDGFGLERGSAADWVTGLAAQGAGVAVRWTAALARRDDACDRRADRSATAA